MKKIIYVEWNYKSTYPKILFIEKYVSVRAGNPEKKPASPGPRKD